MADVLAIGALRAVQDAGLQVPGDISVVGLDGLAIGDYMIPRLTTISQNVEALAVHSFRMLLENIESNISARYEVLPVALKDRESARKIR
jgi:LacI family transcriptional regulator